MKPLKFEDWFMLDTFLLFDCNIISTRYMDRLLSHCTTAVTSKGGIALPPELWSIILRLCRDDPSFVLVMSQSTSQTNDKTILSCQEVQLEERLGRLDDNEIVGIYELFFVSYIYFDRYRDAADDYELYGEWPLPDIEERQAKYRIVIEAGVSTEPYLFGYLEVPDIIACLEGGKCDLCGGERLLRPNQKSPGFPHWKKSKINRACPLCIGPRKWNEHGIYDFPDENWDWMPVKEQQKKMDQYCNRRLKELGYAPLPDATAALPT